MKQQIQNLYGFNDAEKINSALDLLPIATELNIQTASGLNIESHKAILVNNKVIDVPSKHYVLIQHKEAFRPIIEGLTLSGCHDFKFKLFSTHKRAYFEVYTTAISDGLSQIFLGFRVLNSFNRSTTVNYGFKINQGQQYIEIVGYRKVCSNGMFIQVPLEKAEFIRPELKLKVTTLLNQGFSFRHMQGVKERVNNVQYIVEAMALIREPLNLMIKKAKKIEVNSVKALVINHFAERVVKKIESKFSIEAANEGNSLWALYNAITYEASHGELSIANSQKMLETAALILNENI